MVLVVLTVASVVLSANERQVSGFSVGTFINQYGEDFGFGAQVTTPFINDVIAFRLSGSSQFNKVEGWLAYPMVQAGIVGSS